eukprot:4823114-Lingulodinium_polyedra.AAC.1
MPCREARAVSSVHPRPGAVSSTPLVPSRAGDVSCSMRQTRGRRHVCRSGFSSEEHARLPNTRVLPVKGEITTRP